MQEQLRRSCPKQRRIDGGRHSSGEVITDQDLRRVLHYMSIVRRPGVLLERASTPLCEKKCLQSATGITHYVSRVLRIY